MLNHYNPFRPPTLQEVKQRDLEATELALHEAELSLERAQATTEMLKKRIARLKADHA